MRGLRYLVLTSAKNRIVKALKKPITYLYLVGAGFYIVFLSGLILGFSTSFEIDSAEGLAVVLSIFMLFITPSNLLTYAKRKGLIFKPSDSHFVFTSPISAKRILVYAKLKSFIIEGLLVLAVAVVGYIVFNVALWKMILYFLFAYVIESIYETCLMIMLYGNERLSEKTLKWISKGLLILVGAMVVIAVYIIYTDGFSIVNISRYIFSPYFQWVPILGWNLSVLHLLFVGPTTVNMICSALYLISGITFVLMAYKMKCSGEYFEDAAKFADEYQELKARSKRGELVFSLGQKKKKLKKASVAYKGVYAKAIFYRQLLEYKKNRFFIFGPMTLFCLTAGIAITVFGLKGIFPKEFSMYVILGIAAYICICLSGHQPKWMKELLSPYTFLLPDKPVNKLWYATVIEHIRSLIDGCLITIIPGIILGLNPLQIFAIILIYTCIQANRLYTVIFAESILGNLLGNVGIQVTRMMIQGSVLGIGVVVCVFVSVLAGIEVGLIVLSAYAIGMTALFAVLASVTFVRMESNN